MNSQESDALLSIAVLAAHADGARVEAEREELESIAAGLAASVPGQVDREHLPDVARSLMSPETRETAYETAVAVCSSDGDLSGSEREFLAELAREIGIDGDRRDDIERAAGALVALPLEAAAAPAANGELDEMIRRTAILCGGLELLPQGLASLAILPIQMRMVFKIGKRHGYDLDAGHIKDFVATVGLGLTSQYLEGFARRLVGGLIGKLSGGFLRGLSRSATGSAFTYASTLALGRLAERYYVGGRTLSGLDLKQGFQSLFDASKGEAAEHEGEMRRRAGGIGLADLKALVSGS